MLWGVSLGSDAGHEAGHSRVDEASNQGLFSVRDLISV